MKDNFNIYTLWLQISSFQNCTNIFFYDQISSIFTIANNISLWNCYLGISLSNITKYYITKNIIK